MKEEPIVIAAQHLAPGFDYRVKSQLVDLEEEQMSEMKASVAILMHRLEANGDDDDVPNPRVRLLTQLYALLRVEMPNFIHTRFGLDVDSCFVYVNMLFDRIFRSLTGFSLAWSTELSSYGAPPVLRNREMVVFSTELLSLVNSVLCEAASEVFGGDPTVYANAADHMESYVARYVSVARHMLNQEDDDFPLFISEDVEALCKQVALDHALD